MKTLLILSALVLILSFVLAGQLLEKVRSHHQASLCISCCNNNNNLVLKRSSPGGLAYADQNYGDQIEQLASHFNLNAAYLKALITLECSGRKEFNPRFEPHVCRRLRRVTKGHWSSYENITHNTIQDATDRAIENLATSWGPFQVMVYKCIGLGIKVNDLRGDSVVDDRNFSEYKL